MRKGNATNSSVGIRLIPVFLGLFGIVLGIALGALQGYFQTIHFAILTLSVISIAGGLLWLREARWKQTLASLVYSLFFILCVMLVYLLSANRTVRFDITRSQVHTLSPMTQSVLRELPAGRRIMATIFIPQAQFAPMQQFLETYRELNPQFEFQLYDADRDLDIVDRVGGNVGQETMYLTLADESGTPIKKAPPEELSLGDQLREHNLTNAIARLVQRENDKVYYSIGHGEKGTGEEGDGYSKILGLLSTSTVPVEPLRLTQGMIPADAAAIIIAGPTIDLFDSERDLLIQYLDEGGKLFILLDPIYGRDRQLENFEQLLAHVGLMARNEFVVDPISLNVQNSSFTPLVYFASGHAIAKGTSQKPFWLDKARPLAATAQLPQGVTLKGVLITGTETWAEPAEALRSLRSPVPPQDSSQIGSYFAAVSAAKSAPAGRHGNEMRVLLIGDSEAFVNRYHGQNGDAAVFFVQTINWLREREELLQIPPRMLESTPINLTTTKVWAILGFFLLAGLLITVGGTTWALVRRRTR
jgi:hypothetical protein